MKWNNYKPQFERTYAILISLSSASVPCQRIYGFFVGMLINVTNFPSIVRKLNSNILLMHPTQNQWEQIHILTVINTNHQGSKPLCTRHELVLNYNDYLIDHEL